MSDAPSALPSDLKPKWQERFAFFDEYGPLSRPEAKAAFSQLPFRKKGLINMNWFGFFFGGIYWLILGMWRRALVWLAIVFASVFLEGFIEGSTGIEIPRAVDMGITIAINLMAGQATNYSYYIKAVKGDNGWNPFQGLRF